MTSFGLAAAIWFAALAKGGHDLWAVTFLCGLFSIIIVLFLSEYRKRHQLIFYPFVSNFFLILFLTLVSSRYSFDLNTTRLELWICALSVIAFFLFVNVFRDPIVRMRFPGLAGGAIVPLAIMAIWQFYQQPLSRTFSHWSAVGPFANSAVLAGFALTWIIIFWHWRRQGSIYWGLFWACVVILCMARSWWSFFSLMGGFAYYYRKSIKEAFRQRLRFGVMVALGLIALAVLIGIKIQSQHGFLYSAADRLAWWAIGLRMAAEHPWVGVGLGSYATAFPYFKIQGGLNTLYAHSLPIQLVAELGLLGCLGIILLASTYFRAFVQAPEDREQSAYRATLVTLLIYSLTTIFFDYFIGKLLLAMVMALSLCSAKLESFLPTKRACQGAGIVILLLIPGWYLPFRASQYHVEGLRHQEKGELDLALASFQKAIRLNALQDDSYAALASLYKQIYSYQGTPGDLANWRRYLLKAYQFKKDIRYRSELTSKTDVTATGP